MAMRADARRNLDQLLVAARDVIVEKGALVPLEEIAQRAGLGIATLYRRFPDRHALLKAVVLDALVHTRQAAEQASEVEDAFEALATYLRAALDLRVSAVIPQVLDVLDLEDPDVSEARAGSSHAVDALVQRAHDAGALPQDVSFADIGMMLVRIARPLPGPIPMEQKDELARRHLELFIRGLRAPAEGTLDGPSLSLDDLSAMVRND